MPNDENIKKTVKKCNSNEYNSVYSLLEDIDKKPEAEKGESLIVRILKIAVYPVIILAVLIFIVLDINKGIPVSSTKLNKGYIDSKDRYTELNKIGNVEIAIEEEGLKPNGK